MILNPNWLLTTAIAILMLATIIAFISITVAPSILNKLVVLEIISNLLMAGIAVWALLNKAPMFIDICVTLALILFLNSVMYYQYILRREA